MGKQENDNNDSRLINKSKREDDFSTISNCGFIRDTRLSLKAKGLLTLMLTNKEDWNIHLSEIIHHSKDGEASLKTGVKELIACKYMRKIRERDEKGHFKTTLYYIYDEPFDDSKIPLFYKTMNCVTPQDENQLVEPPPVENKRLTNINDNNININKTKLTNYEQSVSETVFVNQIKELFSGDYPFDKNFENDVLKKLETGNVEIDESENLKSYLNYVFERTQLAVPSKSFEGLYRKLALSSSIIMDFKLSNRYQKTENQEQEKTKQSIKYITCSICGNRFAEFENYCSECGVSLKAISGEDKIEYAAHKKLFGMTAEEKQKYEAAYSQWEEQTKKKTGLKFVLPDEKIQFWKSYGILPEETEED